MDIQSQKLSFVNDLFISYSRKDIDFARAIEKALKNYIPPKELPVPKRRLVVFRDEEDFTGVEYNQSLRSHLEKSKKMLVICSPNARASDFVNEEIQLFAEIRGIQNIIPVHLSGIPNNEVSSHKNENLKAFPKSLTNIMPMPLAASFPDFESAKTRPNKGIYEGAWYTVLANFYGISRRDVEQRERKRKNRQIWVGTAFVASIIVVLSFALIVALIQRRNAIKAQIEAVDQLRKNYWSNAVDSKKNDDWLSLLHYSAKAGELASIKSPFKKNVLYNINNHMTIFLSNILDHDGYVRSAFFSQGKARILTEGDDGAVQLWDATNGLSIGQPMKHHDSPVRHAVFSKDGTRILTWSRDHTARLWNSTDGSTFGPTLRHKSKIEGAVFD